MEVFQVIILLVCACRSSGWANDGTVQMTITPSHVDLDTASASQSIKLACCFSQHYEIDSIDWIKIKKRNPLDGTFLTKAQIRGNISTQHPRKFGNFWNWTVDPSINKQMPSSSYLTISNNISVLKPFHTGTYQCVIIYRQYQGGYAIRKIDNTLLEVTGTDNSNKDRRVTKYIDGHDATTAKTPSVTTSTVDYNFSEKSTTHKKFTTHTDINSDKTTDVTTRTCDCSTRENETAELEEDDEDTLAVVLVAVCAGSFIGVALFLYRRRKRVTSKIAMSARINELRSSGNSVISRLQQTISQSNVTDNDGEQPVDYSSVGREQPVDYSSVGREQTVDYSSVGREQPVDYSSFGQTTSSNKRYINEYVISNTVSTRTRMSNKLPHIKRISKGAGSNQHPQQAILFKAQSNCGKVTLNVPDYVNTRYKVHRPLNRAKCTHHIYVNEVVDKGSSETYIDMKPIEGDPLLAYTDSQGYVRQNVFDSVLPDLLNTGSRLVEPDGDEGAQPPEVAMQRSVSNRNNGLIGHIDRFGYLDLNISQPMQTSTVEYLTCCFDNLRDVKSDPSKLVLESGGGDLECDTVDGQGYVVTTFQASARKCACTGCTNGTGQMTPPVPQSKQSSTSIDEDVKSLPVDVDMDVSNSSRQPFDTHYVDTSLMLPTINDHGYDYVSIHFSRRKLVVEAQQPVSGDGVVGNGYLTPI